MAKKTYLASRNQRRRSRQCLRQAILPTHGLEIDRPWLLANTVVKTIQ
ncbi:MAG: hypothetical protein RM049_18300 [Nostoc sp. DedQUE04]|nr:hypothetical protein [Nostoc sp. DedQUE04]MDZ8137227.1 hypothetical protein [Nostoc sp. DedQUE04]